MTCPHCKDTRIDPERYRLNRLDDDGFKTVGVGSLGAIASEQAVMTRLSKGEVYSASVAPCSGCGEGKMSWERAA